jgi:hypothetical protein
VEEGIVAEDEFRGCLGESRRGVDQATLAGHGLGINECREVESLQVGKSPSFVPPRRGGGLFVFCLELLLAR